jgi:hypothetical protein
MVGGGKEGIKEGRKERRKEGKKNGRKERKTKGKGCLHDSMNQLTLAWRGDVCSVGSRWPLSSTTGYN